MKKLQTPLISVYITNYNYGRFIKKSIDSLLNQSFQDFEVIIIDDGSTDNSKEIIESYSDNIKVKIIFQQNKGLNVTNNIALRVAQGKYIMRLDADDYLDSNALLVMSNFLEKNEDLGLVFPDYYIVDSKGDILSLEKRHDFDEEVTLLDQPAHGACTMIRKRNLQTLGGYDEQYKCQDGYELWIKFISRFKVSNIGTPLFYYRQHGSNLTSNENKILDTRAKIKDNYVKEKYSESDYNIAIIPVRGLKHKSNDLALMELGKRAVLDMKVTQALEAKKISQIIISSPSEEIEEYYNNNYINNSKILFHKRDSSLARLNIGLSQTIEEVLELEEVKKNNPVAIVILSIDYPFTKSNTIDDIINTMRIFKTDSMIGVRAETNTFFQHDGNGMKPILNQEKFSRFERESLYMNTGGLEAVRTDFFIKTKKIISGKVGHIVIDQKSSHSIRTKLDREIAAFLADKFEL